MRETIIIVTMMILIAGSITRFGFCIRTYHDNPKPFKLFWYALEIISLGIISRIICF